MSNPIGVHFIPTHTGPHHYDFVRGLRPHLAKLVGGEFPDVQQMADMYQAAPDALHIWRNHALSEQHADVWRDPVGTAHRHVTELHRDITTRYRQAAERGLQLPDRAQVRLIGLNEPVIELFARQEDGSNYGDWLRMMRERTPMLDSYMVNFGKAANNLGYGAELGNFPTGTPANLRPGDYPTFDWFPQTIKLLETTRGRNALADHEYWTAAGGPEAWWDWHTCRFFHFQVDCDIHVLESGVEEAITGGEFHGWQGLLSPEQYVAQHRTYTLRAMTDSRFQGHTPFTLDGGGRWKTHYIEPAMAEFVKLADELRGMATVSQPKPESKPSNIFLPSVPNTTHTVTSAPEAPAQPPAELPDQIDPIALEAVIFIESGGRNYGADGRLLIRFEAHIFRQQLGDDARFAQHFKHNDAGRPWIEQFYKRWPGDSWLPIHTGRQEDEWHAFTIAAEISPEKAARSISMGAPQIMGFNHARIGYATAGEMFDAFQRSANAQIVGLLNFVWSDDDLARAIHRKDWRTVARLYNGSGQVDHYASLMAQAYERLLG